MAVLVRDILEEICSYLYTDDIQAFLSSSKAIRVTATFKSAAWYKHDVMLGLSKYSPNVVALPTCLYNIARVGNITLLSTLINSTHGNRMIEQEAAVKGAIDGLQYQTLKYILNVITVLGKLHASKVVISLAAGESGNELIINLVRSYFNLSQYILIGALNKARTNIIEKLEPRELITVVKSSYLTLDGLLLLLTYISELSDVLNSVVCEVISLAPYRAIEFIDKYHKQLVLTELMIKAILSNQLPVIKHLHLVYDITPIKAQYYIEDLQLEVLFYIAPFIYELEDIVVDATINGTTDALVAYIDKFNIEAVSIFTTLDEFGGVMTEELKLLLFSKGLAVARNDQNLEGIVLRLLDLGVSPNRILKCYNIHKLVPTATISNILNNAT